MNELQAVRVDDRDIVFKKAYDHSWNSDYTGGTLSTAALSPGRHKVELEVLSALVPDADLTGLAADATSTNWPPAWKRWIRTAETELVVCPHDAVIVSQTQDPALDPVTVGGFSLKRIIVRHDGAQRHAVLVFDLNDKLPIGISFDVVLSAGGQTIPCGKLWANKRTNSRWDLTAELAPLAPEINQAVVTLTPNPSHVDNVATIDRIWGKEIVFPQVTLTRQDLGKAVESTNGL
jgi:hypothetical protein